MEVKTLDETIEILITIAAEIYELINKYMSLIHIFTHTSLTNKLCVYIGEMYLTILLVVYTCTLTYNTQTKINLTT